MGDPRHNQINKRPTFAANKLRITRKSQIGRSHNLVCSSVAEALLKLLSPQPLVGVSSFSVCDEPPLFNTSVTIICCAQKCIYLGHRLLSASQLVHLLSGCELFSSVSSPAPD